jgi:triacylglycerol esterase/lipase EstA (alpha/beta hydrolase family)
VLESLSPSRRRFVVGLLALVVTAAAVVVAAVVVTRPEPVDPVEQDRPGPVLLVPGYGGSTVALDVLAEALRSAGRDAEVVELVPPGTQNLRIQAEALDTAVAQALDRAGAESVDVVGYSAGGVVVRLWVAELGGGSLARRAVTLGSPHHGTEVASIGAAITPDTCPAACRQLAEDSDLLRQLNAGDETPPGPAWVTIWTDDDRVVVPPDSGSLEGSVAYSVQDVCPGRTVSHADLPRTPSVIAMVEGALGVAEPGVPGPDVCVS